MYYLKTLALLKLLVNTNLDFNFCLYSYILEFGLMEIKFTLSCQRDIPASNGACSRRILNSFLGRVSEEKLRYAALSVALH